MFAILDFHNKKFRAFEYEKDAMEYADEVARKEGWSGSEDWVPSWIEIVAYGPSETFDMKTFRDYWIEEDM